jgi:transposase
MAVGIAITRTDLDSAGLRRAAAQSRDAARRMLAQALVLDGRSRTEAAQLCGMDGQTLRDRVHRYNDLGLAELPDRVPRNRSDAQASPTRASAPDG